MNYLKINNIKINWDRMIDLDHFSDALIISADYDGKPMTREQITKLNNDRDFVYQCVMNQLF